MRNSALPVEVPPRGMAVVEVQVLLESVTSEVDEKARFYTTLPETPWLEVDIRKNHANAD